VRGWGGGCVLIVVLLLHLHEPSFPGACNGGGGAGEGETRAGGGGGATCEHRSRPRDAAVPARSRVTGHEPMNRMRLQRRCFCALCGGASVVEAAVVHAAVQAAKCCTHTAPRQGATSACVRKKMRHAWRARCQRASRHGQSRHRRRGRRHRRQNAKRHRSCPAPASGVKGFGAFLWGVASGLAAARGAPGSVFHWSTHHSSPAFRLRARDGRARERRARARARAHPSRFVCPRRTRSFWLRGASCRAGVWTPRRRRRHWQ